MLRKMGRWIGIALTGLLCIGLATAALGTTGINTGILLPHAGAEEEVLVAAGETETIVPSEAGLSNEEAAEGYIMQKMSGVPRSALRGTVVGNKLTGREAQLYTLLRAKCEAVAAGQLASTEFTVPVKDLYDNVSFTAGELGVENFSTEANIKAGMREFYNRISINTQSVMNALSADCAYDMYWFDKTRGMGSSLPPVSYSSSKMFLYDYNNETVTFSFYVAAEYSASGNPGTFAFNTTLYGSTVEAAVTRAHGIVEANQGKSDLEKLEAYRDAICGLVDYNEEAANDDDREFGNPWQLIWVFDGDPATKVVCEGYSKAFQYLCDETRFRKNIYSILVTGTMGGGTGAGPHMWNILTMDDGKRYIADITNSDSGSVGGGGGLFLNGYDSYYPDYNQYNYKIDDYNSVMYVYDSKTTSLYSLAELAMEGEDYTEPEETDMTWEDIQSLITDGGTAVTITLESDVIFDSGLEGTSQPLTIPAGKQVTIDLNGYTIDRGRGNTAITGGYIFHVENGSTLVIRDNSATGGGTLTGAYDADGHGCVFNEGSFTLEGGTISGNRGGVENLGTFTMAGGTITGNTSATTAGGIYAAQGSTVHLQGGTITGNTGKTAGGAEICGSITMEGSPVVNNNTSDDGPDMLIRSSDTPNVIQITGQIGTEAQVSITVQGTTPYVLTSGLTENGGGVNPFISDDDTYQVVILNGEATIGIPVTVSFDGNGGTGSISPITLLAGTETILPDFAFAAPEGKIFGGWKVGITSTIIAAGGNYTPTQNVTLTAQWTDETTQVAWSDFRAMIQTGEDVATYTLDSDIVAGTDDQPLLIPAGKAITIDLNGYTIDRNMNKENISKSYTGHAIQIEEGGSLILRDTSAAGNGKVTGEKADVMYGCITNFGTFTMNSGAISGNYGDAVENYGTFTMNGGTITGNGHSQAGVDTSLEVAVSNRSGYDAIFIMNGGSIVNNKGDAVMSYGTVELNDGMISGNTSGGIVNHGQMTMSGGTIIENGFDRSSGSAIYMGNNGTLTITGGEIQGNYGNSTIYVQSGCVMTMNGGTIAENHCCGIFVSGTLNLSGNMTFGNNVYPDGSSYSGDIRLAQGKVITLTGELDPTVSMTVEINYSNQYPAAITAGFRDENGNARAYASSFVPTSAAYIRIMKDGEVGLDTSYRYPMDNPDFVLPAEIRTIGNNAFAGTDASVVKIPKGTEAVTIESGAFADCAQLRQIYIPSNVTSIAEDAFDDHMAIVIFGESGSTANTFADAHDCFTFIIKND